MYDNQEKIDMINSELRNIDECLKISGYRLVGNKVIGVNVTIMEKGNAKLIKALLRMGWVKTWREKVRSDDGYERNQYSGYGMRILMELDV